MEPDYWGGQVPPVGSLGGPVAPPSPPGSYSTERVFVSFCLLIFFFSVLSVGCVVLYQKQPSCGVDKYYASLRFCYLKGTDWVWGSDLFIGNDSMDCK